MKPVHARYYKEKHSYPILHIYFPDLGKLWYSKVPIIKPPMRLTKTDLNIELVW